MSWIFDLHLCLAKLFGRLGGATLDSSILVPLVVSADPVTGRDAKTDLLRSALWTTLFRGGYRGGRLQRSLSGKHEASDDSLVSEFLLSLLEPEVQAPEVEGEAEVSDEKPEVRGIKPELVVQFLKRCQEQHVGPSVGDKEVSDAANTIMAALIWHSQPLREDLERYIKNDGECKLYEGLVQAYTVAQAQRIYLLDQRQKHRLAMEKEPKRKCPPVDPVKNAKVKAEFLLRFSGLAKVEVRRDSVWDTKRKQSLRQLHRLSSHTLDKGVRLDSVLEKYPAFRLVLEFVKDPAWSLQKVGSSIWMGSRSVQQDPVSLSVCLSVCLSLSSLAISFSLPGISLLLLCLSSVSISLFHSSLLSLPLPLSHPSLCCRALSCCFCLSLSLCSLFLSLTPLSTLCPALSVSALSLSLCSLSQLFLPRGCVFCPHFTRLLVLQVQELLQARSQQAQAVADVYMFAAEYLRIMTEDHVFQVPSVLFIRELLGYQADFAKHYADGLDGCGLELESRVRRSYYTLLRRLIDALRSTNRNQLDKTVMAAYDYVQACTLHFLDINWQQYDLAFLVDVRVPELYVGLAKNSVAVRQQLVGEVDEEQELRVYSAEQDMLKECKVCVREWARGCACVGGCVCVGRCACLVAGCACVVGRGVRAWWRAYGHAWAGGRVGVRA